MSKTYHVTPRRQPGRASYIVNFYNASGVRVTKGLGTEIEARALILCHDLVRLRLEGIETEEDAAVAGIDPQASAMYFARTGSKAPVTPLAANFKQLEAAAAKRLQDYPKGVRRHIRPLLADNAALTYRVSTLAQSIATRTQERDALQTALDSLQRSVIGKAATAGARVPAMDKALEIYKQALQTVSPRMQTRYLNCAEAFAAKYPDVKTPADARVDQIAEFLDNWAAPTKYTRRQHRTFLGRFFNWAAERWEYPTPMQSVPGVSKNEIQRERGDIQWHEIDEVEAALKGLENNYWRGVVATLVYAGLQLAELVWLRVVDLRLNKSGTAGTLWVTVVEESEGVRHDLKTGNRRREVPIDKVYLLPRLKAYLKAGGAGEAYLFPMPSDVKRRKRSKTVGLAERWLPESLSKKLVGDAGGKKSKPKPGLLPSGMTPIGLRRTFGSLCKRAGFSDEEIATLMGNTADVVHDHYARLSGPELLEKRIRFLGRGG